MSSNMVAGFTIWGAKRRSRRSVRKIKSWGRWLSLEALELRQLFAVSVFGPQTFVVQEELLRDSTGNDIGSLRYSYRAQSFDVAVSSSAFPNSSSTSGLIAEGEFSESIPNGSIGGISGKDNSSAGTLSQYQFHLAEIFQAWGNLTGEPTFGPLFSTVDVPSVPVSPGNAAPLDAFFSDQGFMADLPISHVFRSELAHFNPRESFLPETSFSENSPGYNFAGKSIRTSDDGLELSKWEYLLEPATSSTSGTSFRVTLVHTEISFTRSEGIDLDSHPFVTGGRHSSEILIDNSNSQGNSGVISNIGFLQDDLSLSDIGTASLAAALGTEASERLNFNGRDNFDDSESAYRRYDTSAGKGINDFASISDFDQFLDDVLAGVREESGTVDLENLLPDNSHSTVVIDGFIELPFDVVSRRTTRDMLLQRSSITSVDLSEQKSLAIRQFLGDFTTRDKLTIDANGNEIPAGMIALSDQPLLMPGLDGSAEYFAVASVNPLGLLQMFVRTTTDESQGQYSQPAIEGESNAVSGQRMDDNVRSWQFSETIVLAALTLAAVKLRRPSDQLSQWFVVPNSTNVQSDETS